MRLNKYLAEAGYGARRKVENLIIGGKVKINNKIITQLATVVDPKKDKVSVDNYRVHIEPKVYIMLNKPSGFITTVSDELNRKTVLNLINILARIYPVGRLDKNSRGLVLMTNDGDLTSKIIHPSSKIEKTYIVRINSKLDAKQLKRFSDGVMLDNKKTAPAKIKLIKPSAAKDLKLPLYEVLLTQGKKRQIRRMFEVLDRKVYDLERVQIGPLKLTNLKEGKWRHLTKYELNEIIKTIDR